MRSKIVKKSTILLVCISIIMSMLVSININANALTQSEMINKISAKYSQNTWLGNATTNYTYLGGGMFRHYEQGSIYIGNNVGVACVVYGQIRDKWASLGWETGFLGSPTTDELGTPDGVGRFNHFEGGSIYWTPSLGAFSIQGDIRSKWASLGWETSFLGYPVTDECTTPDGIGRYTHFQGGSIYWHPASGAYEVHGLIREKWANMGWEKSLLGYPLSDELTTADGTGRYTQFQGGRVYYHPNYGTYYITGKTYLQWADAGAEKSTYGYPISDPKDMVINNKTYTVQNFAKGSISIAKYDKSTKIDLRKEIARRGIAIDNQGGRGTCSVFAMTFLLEYQLSGLFGKTYNNLSQEYLNHMANKASNRTCDGDFFWAIENGYKSYGIIPNSMLPYNANLTYNYADMDKRITTSMTNFGAFTLSKGVKLNGRFIKKVDEPVGLTATQFNDVINCLNKLTPVAIGRSHSMVIVGYEYNSSYPGGGYFIFRNSWGTGSGDNGYVVEDFAKVKAETNDAYVFEGLVK